MSRHREHLRWNAVERRSLARQDRGLDALDSVCPPSFCRVCHRMRAAGVPAKCA